VTDETKVILGVTCVVVRDTVYVGGPPPPAGNGILEKTLLTGMPRM
jgi:hypothetical protein